MRPPSLALQCKVEVGEKHTGRVLGVSKRKGWLTALSCATLAVAGAGLTAATTGATGPVAAVLTIAANLFGSAAGNSFHELTSKGENGLSDLFAGSREIDRNLHVVLAMREANLSALRTLVEEHAGPERDDFVERMRRYLAEASATERSGHSEIAAFEGTIFRTLADAFDEVLADDEIAPRSESSSVRAAIEDAVLAELASDAGLELVEIPTDFVAGFRRADGGWLDLFVSDAARRLNSNESFRTAWQSGKLAAISKAAGRLTRSVEIVSQQVHNVDDKLGRHHREEMEALEAIRLEIARQKGVPAEALTPLLERLGHENVPLADIPRVLSAAIDALKKRSEAFTFIHNDGAAIDEAIKEARSKLAEADSAAAIGIIDAALETDETYERALEAEDEARKHREQMGRARARAFYERAFIQRTTFDREGAIKSFLAGLQLDPNEIWEWFFLGDELKVLGRFEDAKRAYTSGGEAALRAGDERNYSVSLNKVGDVQAFQGSLDEALSSYAKSKTCSERVAQRHPGNTVFQHDVTVAHSNIGDILFKQGRIDEATNSFSSGLGIINTLIENEPENGQWRLDQSQFLNKIIEIRVLQGNFGEAEQYARQSEEISRSLVNQNPSSYILKNALAITLEKLGDVLCKSERFEHGISFYRESLQITEDQLECDPKNPGITRCIAIYLAKIGTAQFQLGELDNALTLHLRSLKIREELHSIYPDNALWARDLMFSYVRLAQMDRRSSLYMVTKALNIASDLLRRGRLEPRDIGMVEQLKEWLRNFGMP